MTLSPTTPVAQAQEFIGDSGTYSLKKLADVQDFKFVSATTDPSFTYASNTWKFEVQHPYVKKEGSLDLSVKKPGESGWQPVALAVFKNACPNKASSYGNFDAVVFNWWADNLRPTRTNLSLAAIFSWVAAFLAFSILN